MSDGKPRRPVRESVGGKPASQPAQVVHIMRPVDPPAPPVPELPAAAEPIAAAAVAVLPAPATMVALPPAAPTVKNEVADPWAAMIAMQSVFGRGCEQALAEVAGAANAGMAASRDTALALLGAKTMSDAVAAGTEFVRRGFDTMIDGTAKLSEIGVKTMTDASRPLLSPVRG